MLKNTFPVAPPFGALATLALVRFTCCMISSARHVADRPPAGFCSVSVGALLMILVAERGRLFQPHNPPV